MKILIDNGHGENTQGKRSPDGTLREYSYTREIADRIVLELTKRGYDAERIVKENVDVPLTERTRRVNEVCGRLGTSNVILVSIHCNAAANGGWQKARGWSAYTSIGRTKADELADRLYESARMYFTGQRIREDRSDGDPDWEEGFFVLRKTKCPAVLTENFFQDNKEDVAYLLSSDGKQAIVNVHVDGIINYINDNE